MSEEVRSRCHLKHRVPQTISESTSSDSISGDLAAHIPHIPHPPVSPQATSAVSPGGTFTSPAPFPSGGGCGGMSPKATPDLPVFAPAGKCATLERSPYIHYRVSRSFYCSVLLCRYFGRRSSYGSKWMPHRDARRRYTVV